MAKHVPAEQDSVASVMKPDGRGQLSNYIKIKKLGSGGFGSAYLVRKKNGSDGKAFVMKQINCKTKEEVLQALREMVTLRILQCPYVVSYEEYFQQGLSVFLVMEYCEGGDLYTEMNGALSKGQQLPEDTIMKWFVQIAMGLAEIHEKTFMHRDIKPSNVFLDSSGNAKLGDFGLTNVGGKSKEDNVKATLCGTPGFISPEIQKGEAYNAKSDVYALGCCLYEMLCLRSAYQDNMDEIFPQPVPSHYSEDVKDLLSALLQSDPRSRPHIAEVLQKPYVRKYVDRLLGRSRNVDSLLSSTAANKIDPNGIKGASDSVLDLSELLRMLRGGDIIGLKKQFETHPVGCMVVLFVVLLSLKVVGIL